MKPDEIFAKSRISIFLVLDPDEVPASGSDTQIQREDQGYKFQCKFNLKIELHANHEGIMKYKKIYTYRYFNFLAHITLTL